MTLIPMGNPGVAADAYEAFTNVDLLLSNTPTFFTVDMTLAESQDIALYEVVSVDGSGNVIPAVSGTSEAIGICAGAITSGSGENPVVQVIRGGHFNIDALVWDASYTTDALKTSAFDGADAPTIIVAGINKFNRT